MLPSNFQQTPAKPLSIKKVWLLNSIPFLGAGYIYATKEKGLPLMLFVWALEAVYFTPWTMIWVYFILSILGTAHIIKDSRSRNGVAHNNRDRKQIGTLRSQKQVTSSEGNDDLSISKRKSRAVKKAARKAAALKYEEEDKSARATDLFEHKLAAAEKMIKARESAVGAPDFNLDADFSPADAPKFSDEEKQKSVEEIFATPPAVTGGAGGYSYGTENNSGVMNRSPGANLDNVFDKPYGTGLPQMDLSADTPSVVPDVSSLVASSASEIPELTSMISDSTTSVADVASMVAGTDSSSIYVSPKFSFTYDDHQSPSSGTATSGGAVINCTKCNAVKDSNFSFCLSCGHSFG